jgi:hypothetical protein
MNRSFRSLASLLVLGAVPAYVACAGNSNLPPPPPAPNALPAVSTSAPVASSSAPPVDTSAPTAPKPPDVQLSLGAAAPDPTDKPTVKLAAPAKGQVIPTANAGDFEVKLDVKKWPTAVGDAHIHVILDNNPYKPIYDTKKPIKLKDIPGGATISEGHHVLVAFASRATHESVKTAGAMTVIDFYVGKKTTPAFDLSKPMLVYSRPKGDYKGDMANHVIVDFQLVNETLADGKDHVHIKVTGPGIDGAKEADAVKFGPPLYLDNLQNGSYTVHLELLGADNKVLPGPWNIGERVIVIDHNAPMDPGMHGAPPAPSSSAPAPSSSAAH